MSAVDAPLLEQPSGLSAWDRALIGVGAFLFFVSFWLYYTGYPMLRSWLHGDASSTGEPVGLVEKKQGVLKRQKAAEVGFQSISQSAKLYNEDTVVTQSDSTAVIQLSDGESIELSPGTMIQLKMESSYQLGGIVQTRRVELVTGSAKAKPSQKSAASALSAPMIQIKQKVIEAAQVIEATRPIVAPAMDGVKAWVSKISEVALPEVKMPEIKNLPTVIAPTQFNAKWAETLAIASPPPPPLPELKKMKLISPPPQAQLKLRDFSEKLELSTPFSWELLPAPGEVEWGIHRIKDPGLAQERRQEIERKAVTMDGTLGKAEWILDEPGSYEWEILGKGGEAWVGHAPVRGRFEVLPQFLGIESLEALISGQKLRSNRLSEHQVEEFVATFRWRMPPGLVQRMDGRFRFRLAEDRYLKRILVDEQTKESEFSWSRGKVPRGQYFYEVSVPLERGFVATSEIQSWKFQFNGPVLVTPKNQSTLTVAQIENQNAPVLLTWEKTLFTEAYLVEIAIEPTFLSKSFEARSAQNYMILPALKPGKYFWRVKSINKNFASEPSELFELRIQ